ncbi:unnamed protein product [Ostreobium quekettii]|uniref:Secreted protein n=1 Tax=Ostreobium quekettii TaxID=121088 RepID=A0A8S1J388_9CHLO|nr:unnamed protein product [Ostreobium quekettii]
MPVLGLATTIVDICISFRLCLLPRVGSTAAPRLCEVCANCSRVASVPTPRCLSVHSLCGVAHYFAWVLWDALRVGHLPRGWCAPTAKFFGWARAFAMTYLLAGGQAPPL